MSKYIAMLIIFFSRLKHEVVVYRKEAQWYRTEVYYVYRYNILNQEILILKSINRGTVEMHISEPYKKVNIYNVTNSKHINPMILDIVSNGISRSSKYFNRVTSRYERYQYTVLAKGVDSRSIKLISFYTPLIGDTDFHIIGHSLSSITFGRPLVVGISDHVVASAVLEYQMVNRITMTEDLPLFNSKVLSTDIMKEYVAALEKYIIINTISG